jgi:hypothetical protein
MTAYEAAVRALDDAMRTGCAVCGVNVTWTAEDLEA